MVAIRLRLPPLPDRRETSLAWSGTARSGAAAGRSEHTGGKHQQTILANAVIETYGSNRCRTRLRRRSQVTFLCALLSIDRHHAIFRICLDAALNQQNAISGCHICTAHLFSVFHPIPCTVSTLCVNTSAVSAHVRIRHILNSVAECTTTEDVGSSFTMCMTRLM